VIKKQSVNALILGWGSPRKRTFSPSESHLNVILFEQAKRRFVAGMTKE
jgi:hypothetical protein